MSLIDKNGPALATNSACHDTIWKIVSNAETPTLIRDNLYDVWLNIAPFFNVSADSPCFFVLNALVSILDPLAGGTVLVPKALEMIGQLAANPDKNEEVLTARFDDVLPRMVDELISPNPVCASAAVTALCNVSAFDWPARGRMAQTPRLIGRLVSLLKDPELAPRAALTLLNLSEAPNNRKKMLEFEEAMVQRAVVKSPAAETLACVLAELASD
eukprot:CAMPEP_0198325754 /NCGR_PEP_ID=MMETSP1450-20131203/13425_1 /TAXON_ID=753684 ORGANISM="Madagascaria erythrocladiodes, Strain CCMP3234" /NCGR_SAMPLE_ID=MMETSP1450 /ASSEMBLY_ACC=CAM_ASM_001115 /LENGTH=214 /DNA_ID=CAMNT_0044029671 /DNA_START=16 /DNA_END=660 /DNA_ORIENTATION=+